VFTNVRMHGMENLKKPLVSNGNLQNLGAWEVCLLKSKVKIRLIWLIVSKELPVLPHQSAEHSILHSWLYMALNSLISTRVRAKQVDFASWKCTFPKVIKLYINIVFCLFQLSTHTFIAKEDVNIYIDVCLQTLAVFCILKQNYL
jgi:hypothetical protein